MKREEIQAKFEGITDEQLDWLMDQNGKDVNAVRFKLNESKAGTRDLQSQIADLQAQLDAANAKSMSAEEQLKAKLDAAEQKERDYAIKASRLDARAVFVDAGIPDDSMDGLLDLVANGDSEQSVERSKALVALIQGQSEKAVAEARKQLVNETPKPKGQGAPGGMTKADFDKLDYGEKLEMLNDDPNLLTKLR